MTNEEYFNTLLKLSGVKNDEPGILTRKLNITVAMDRYGAPSTAIIAFEGSPPRFEVIFRMDTAGMPIMVNDCVIGRQGRWSNKREHLFVFLVDFVESRKAEWNANLRQVMDRSAAKPSPSATSKALEAAPLLGV